MPLALIVEESAKEEEQLDSYIFTQHLPVIGKVPMVFYLPADDSKEYLQFMIERNGGRVVEMHECFSF